MRVLKVDSAKQVKDVMRKIGVDAYGIEIMASKAFIWHIKIDALSNIAANILKQEMLSLGGDVAIARGSLTGRVRKTDCLLMGTLAQLRRLIIKLKAQPFGLSGLADDLAAALDNCQKEDFILRPRAHTLHLSRRTHIMGILNLTPDSFSGDGWYKVQSTERRVQSAIEAAMKMAEEGADIIDIGGESSRPGAKPVSQKEEIERTQPVIKKLARLTNTPISIDTYKPEVAKAALESGACIINDITGLRASKMAKLAAKYKCGVVVMHMKGEPRTMQKNPQYRSLMGEIIEYLGSSIHNAEEAGVKQDQIIIDPGIGFGKTLEHNLEILSNIRELKVLGRPILVGPSRKSFIGKILNLPPEERLYGSVASAALAALNGAHIVRVHDVRETKEALKVADAILKG